MPTKPTPKPPPPERTPIADELRAAIAAYLAAGGTVHALAKLAKVHRSPIDRFLDGSRGLELMTVERLARPLNLKLVQVTATAGRARRRGAKADA